MDAELSIKEIDKSKRTHEYTQLSGFFAILVIGINYALLYFSGRSQIIPLMQTRILILIQNFTTQVLHQWSTDKGYLYALKIVVNLLELVPVFLLLIICKESIQSIGLNWYNLLKSIILNSLACIGIFVVHTMISLLQQIVQELWS